MAGAMVGGALLSAFLDVVFDKLASTSLPHVVDFIRGKKLEPLLERLEENLMVVKVVLDDAENKQVTNSNINKWLNELKDVVYMADDLLDEVSTKAATQNEVTTDLFSHFTKIVEKLDRILKLKQSLDLKEIPADNSSARVPSTSVPERNIYGRDEDKKAIIKLLLDDSNEGEQVYVIPIVGMGGVGKTTLAQMVYNDDALKQNFNFDFKAWVCVSEPFDIIKVTKTLTEALTQQACQSNDLNSLQEKLVEKLKGKKFLIIFDDVWNEDYDSWNLLKKPLQYGIPGSKILVTTRTEHVASLVQTVQTYHLSQLSNEDCWSVFANHACLSPGSSDNTTTLEKIGSEIVKKCKGLPLAAQSLGGLLRRKRDIKDWNSVLNCDIWELSESESKIIPSLRISYHYLPPYLKRCFVYLSLYPKDFEFYKDDVILLWMAEDLLPPPKKEKALEDVGDECFDYLVSSSFIQRSSDPNKKKSFGMHDLMHDLATFLGGEFYFRSYDIGDATTIGSKTRHFSFINFRSFSLENDGVLGSAKFLRTFVRIETDLHIDDRVLRTELPNLEYLRVLSFHFIGLVGYISGMIHLRYLDLSRTTIKLLPDSLCDLYNLQTLKLEYCGMLTMLPSGMQNLVNLRYLGISGTRIKEMPKGMGKLKHLHHLPYFTVGKHEEITIKELGGLSNLHGWFSIEKLENVENSSEALGARMMDKKHIRSLALQWSSGESCMDSQREMDILCKLQPDHQDLQFLQIDGYRGTRYPDWVGNPCYHNMTSIILSRCDNCFMLPSLGHLPSLMHLSISDFKTLVTIDGSFSNNNNNNDGGSLLTVPFPSLKSLVFEKMPCWEEWSCSEQLGAFPLLKCVRIEDCPKLKGDLPSHLPSLEELTIKDCEQFEKMSCWEEWSCSEQPRAFPKLNRLAILHCPKLKGDLPSDLPALEELRIEDCEQLTCPDLLRAPALRKIAIVEANKVMKSVFGDIIHKQPTCLKYLRLSDCSSAVSFPGDCIPASLKILNINGFRKLEFPQQQQTQCESLLESLKIKSSCDSLTSLRLETFPNLKYLHISDCVNLESLSVSRSQDFALQNLTDLEIKECPNLVSLAREGLAAPSLISLRVSDCNKLESLPRGMNTLLPQLESLEIHRCPRLESFPEQYMPPSLRPIGSVNCETLLSGLAWPSMDVLTDVIINGPCDGMKSFPNIQQGMLPPSLKKLTLSDFSSLETLDCEGLLHLTYLEELAIEDCPKLESMAGMPPSLTSIEMRNSEKLLLSGLPWPSMDKLTVLSIWGPCVGIKSFPEEGLLPPSLQSLSLGSFSSLEMLDCKGLLHLTHLQSLSIWECRKLEDMAGERLPASLTQLHIYGCPLLEEHFHTKDHRIWPKISHIQDIHV